MSKAFFEHFTDLKNFYSIELWSQMSPLSDISITLFSQPKIRYIHGKF